MASQIVTTLCPKRRDAQEAGTPPGAPCPVFDLWAYRSRRRAGKKTDGQVFLVPEDLSEEEAKEWGLPFP